MPSLLPLPPYDEPEIAVAIVGEKCGRGNVLAPVAAGRSFLHA